MANEECVDSRDRRVSGMFPFIPWFLKAPVADSRISVRENKLSAGAYLFCPEPGTYSGKLSTQATYGGRVRTFPTYLGVAKVERRNS